MMNPEILSKVLQAIKPFKVPEIATLKAFKTYFKAINFN